MPTLSGAFVQVLIGNAAGTLVQRRAVEQGKPCIDVVPSLEEEVENEVLD